MFKRFLSSYVSLNTSGAFILLFNTILFLNSNVSFLSSTSISLQYFNKKNNRYTVKRGTKIWVKVEDLPSSTKHRVVYLCDFCNKEFEVNWDSYQKNNHDGKNFCNACAKKIYNSGENNWNWKPNKTNERWDFFGL